MANSGRQRSLISCPCIDVQPYGSEMTRSVFGSYPNFVRQGRNLRRRGLRSDMKPTREDFVAGEGTTDGLHEGSG